MQTQVDEHADRVQEVFLGDALARGQQQQQLHVGGQTVDREVLLVQEELLQQRQELDSADRLEVGQREAVVDHVLDELVEAGEADLLFHLFQEARLR